MIDIEIRNKNVLKLLDEIVYLHREKWDPVVYNQLACSSKDANRYISDEFKDHIMSMGTRHEGAADKSWSYLLKFEHFVGDRKLFQQYKDDFRRVNDELKEELGLDCNALSTAYPPGGYIGWHNNANAPAYNLLFTWSETGAGWFKYVDPKTGETITMHDKPGWQCKAGYYGTYDEPDHVIYHAAYTECWRMTHSFTLGFSEDYWLDCIEYIQTE